MPFCVTCRDENTGQEVEPLIVEAASEVAARSYAEARGMIVGEVVFLPILKRIGYWTAGEQPPVYPHPGRLVDPLWRCADRARIVAYLQSGLCIASALGHSWCRHRADHNIPWAVILYPHRGSSRESQVADVACTTSIGGGIDGPGVYPI